MAKKKSKNKPRYVIMYDNHIPYIQEVGWTNKDLFNNTTFIYWNNPEGILCTLFIDRHTVFINKIKAQNQLKLLCSDMIIKLYSIVTNNAKVGQIKE